MRLQQKITRREARGMLPQARAGRDVSSIVAAARALLHQNDRRAIDIAISLARTLMESGRPRDALPVWRFVIRKQPSCIEAAYQIWIVDKNDPALSGLGPEHIALLEDVQEFRRSETPTAPLHHVAIGGVSYCGSTLCERMLEGLSGVASIGESHWITKHQHDRKPMTFETALDGTQTVPCSSCGDECSVLTRDFRIALAADHTNWYQRIGARLGCDHLISSDKNLDKLVDNDPALRFDAIILFKSPEQAWCSTLKRLPQGMDGSFYWEKMGDYMEKWARAYSHFLYDFRPTGDVVFIHFDEFAKFPERFTKILCKNVDLPFSRDILSRTSPGHAVGGNRDAVADLKEREYAIDVQPLRPASVPDAHLDYIRNHNEVSVIYQQLLHKHAKLTAAF